MASATTTTKPDTKPKKGTDNFDDDFEKVETIFPPIFYPEKINGVIVFIPQILREGPNGSLLTCKLISNTCGTFKRNEEEAALEDNIFALGITPTLTGDDKLVLKKNRGEKGELSPLGEYLIENDLPVKLVYLGKKKSKANKGYAYHLFEFYAHKKAIAATKDNF